MEFQRRKVKGRTKDTYKEFWDTGRNYRITWCREYGGVRIQGHYQACLKVVRSFDDREVWIDFAGARRPYKTLKAAIAACENNERLWKAFIDLGQSTGRREARLEKLIHQSRVGNKPTVNVMLKNLPVWVIPEADPKLLRMLFPVGKKLKETDDECNLEENGPSTNSLPSDPTIPSETSAPSESPKAPEHKSSSKRTRTKLPVPSAADLQKSSIPPPSGSTKPEPSTSPAPNAKVTAARTRKASVKNTKSSSTNTEPKQPSTKRSSRSAK